MGDSDDEMRKLLYPHLRSGSTQECRAAAQLDNPRSDEGTRDNDAVRRLLFPHLRSDLQNERPASEDKHAGEGEDEDHSHEGIDSVGSGSCSGSQCASDEDEESESEVSDAAHVAGDGLHLSVPDGYDAGVWNSLPVHMQLELLEEMPSAVTGEVDVDSDSSHGSKSRVSRRLACRHGIYCNDQSPEHSRRFVHPGDRDYRQGVAIFESGAHPQFQTLNQLFRFFDVNESGHLSKESFASSLPFCQRLTFTLGKDSTTRIDFKRAWQSVGGNKNGTVNFARFADWAEQFGVALPVGLADGTHRPSRAHSDGLWGSTLNWSPNMQGLVEVTDSSTQLKLQRLLNLSHQTANNWTRDRGCSKHGVNGCDLACASKNRALVPDKLLLRRVFRNQNIELWQRYVLTRAGILDECSHSTGTVPFMTMTQPDYYNFDETMSASSNEWRLFHGTSPEACLGILGSGFKVELSGTGATWKSRRETKGTPLYGFGLYFAEKITKADEYAKPLPKGHGFEGLCAILLCRVIGGRSNVVTTNEIDRDKLRTDVFCGPFHSVLGDRITTLGKPYREVVVYDKDQVYPEFLLVYERVFSRSS